MLAGKYGPLLGAATGAVLGAGGSLLGNSGDQEQEGLARLGAEALLAGAAGSIPGLAVGRLPQVRRQFQKSVVKNIPRTAKTARNTAMSAFDKGLAIGGGISAAVTPLYAGAGGMVGGGLSNVANLVGIPGFQPGINPESYGSSNTQAI